MALDKYIYTLMTDRRSGPADQLVKGVLYVLSLVYGAAVALTRRLYVLNILPSYRPPKPVISIGNLTVGGTGKTPLVITVVQALMARQCRVAVVTRGHMAAGKTVPSDEARMLQERLPGVPVLAGADRRKSIEEFLKRQAVDVFVCDDAFQHWPLQRDLDIVAVNAANAFGNGQLLPRGILREPKTVLARAQIFVLTKTDNADSKVGPLCQELKQLNPSALIAQSRHAGRFCVDVYGKTIYDLSHLKGLSVVGFCGIADPGSFRRNLDEAGLNALNIFVFMDHHVYTEEDLAQVRRYAQDHRTQVIVTTHKDAVKLQGFGPFWQGFKLYYLHLELEITHEKNVFFERILTAAGR